VFTVAVNLTADSPERLCCEPFHFCTGTMGLCALTAPFLQQTSCNVVRAYFHLILCDTVRSRSFFPAFHFRGQWKKISFFDWHN
jgi:hypothetical protein